MTVEQQSILSPREQGRGQQQHMLPWGGLAARAVPSPARSREARAHWGSPSPWALPISQGWDMVPQVSPAQQGPGPGGAGLWGAGVWLCCSIAGSGAGGPWGLDRDTQDWRSPQGPGVFSKNRTTE